MRSPPPPPGVKHGVGAGADYSAPGRGLSFFKNAVLGLGLQLQPQPKNRPLPRPRVFSPRRVLTFSQRGGFQVL